MRILAIAIFFASFASAQAASPASPESIARYKQELDRLERLAASMDPFDEPFWRESKRVADRSRPEIVAAVLLRARKWKNEQGLIFVPLVALLPRQPTLKLLRQYERSPHELERIWAREFIIELDASDTKEGVRRFSK